jgi:hypothetical protein
MLVGDLFYKNPTLVLPFIRGGDSFYALYIATGRRKPAFFSPFSRGRSRGGYYIYS